MEKDKTILAIYMNEAEKSKKKKKNCMHFNDYYIFEVLDEKKKLNTIYGDYEIFQLIKSSE